ncbi:LOG family protein [Marinoscillum pacificum]|uniref:LOG family protein n=1 Tax=Marinoscillum pacificum TaxID=392723 RepID=UPI0021586F61|nr:TIGR00730 family Rossman fold protein [Marinoscillum pacificum]
MIQRLAIFCGSSAGNNPIYKEEAYQVGKLMAKKGIEVIYGGGKVGLMGVVADAALEHGGKVIGVIPEKLMEWEVGHDGLTELHIVKTMHERKAMMADLSDGFVALPGGIGTMEEIIEVFTWHQIGYHNKPCAFLNTSGYYNKFFSFIEHSVSEGFLSQQQCDELIIEETFEKLLVRMG